MATWTTRQPGGFTDGQIKGIESIVAPLARVAYGNIGGENRLDFTCIGAAVNLAARLEKLAGKLGRSILASDEFARHCGSDFQPIGKFPLAGFAAQQTVFGVSDEEKFDTLPMEN